MIAAAPRDPRPAPHVSRWTIALVTCMLGGGGGAVTGCGGAGTMAGGAGTQAAAPAPAPVSAAAAPNPANTLAASTLAGVYTEEQAARGKDVYTGTCQSCHTPQSHTGATFAKWWVGKRLSDLYTYVATNMPDNDPGSLAPESAADVVAYLLKLNAMPAGGTELPPDADSLKKIRIAVK